MRKRIKIGLIGFIVFLFLFGSIRAYYRLTDDFRMGNITYTLPFKARWEVPLLTSEEYLNLSHILNQKFSYIGKGAQSYAFASEDQQYVLKFFKFKHLKPNFLIEFLPSITPFKGFKQSCIERKNRKLMGVFNGYDLAFRENRQGSKLLYLHLLPSENLQLQATVIDKIGMERKINLDDVVFLIQRKGETLRTRLNRLLGEEHLQEAQQAISSILQMYISEYKRGIFDHDHGVMHNTGFVDNQPFHLDVGNLNKDERIREISHYKKDLEHILWKMDVWVKACYPQYYQKMSAFLEEEYQQLTGERVNLKAIDRKRYKKEVDRIQFFQTFYHAFLHLAYPTKCIHCHLLLPPDSPLFCSTCSSLFELLNPDEHCPHCFYVLPHDGSSLCANCLHSPSNYSHLAAAFSYEGPAATLVKRLKYANQPYLACGIASFLMLQFDRLQWPLPDVLVPVPLSFMHWLERGYNQSALIAEEMGKFLQRPVWKMLKRESGDYSQAALTIEQRKTLSAKGFKLNAKYSIKGKTLLVIDDVMTSGTTLERCAELLKRGEPASLYALTFCRTYIH